MYLNTPPCKYIRSGNCKMNVTPKQSKFFKYIKKLFFQHNIIFYFIWHLTRLFIYTFWVFLFIFYIICYNFLLIRKIVYFFQREKRKFDWFTSCEFEGKNWFGKFDTFRSLLFSGKRKIQHFLPSIRCSKVLWNCFFLFRFLWWKAFYKSLKLRTRAL